MSSDLNLFLSSEPILAIDPGATGALAVLDPVRWRLAVTDTPSTTIKVSGKDRRVVDHAQLADFMRASNARLLVSEKLHSRPGQGAANTFSLGRYVGHIEMGAACFDIQHLTPTPQEWKRRMQVSADKDLSRARASQLVPAAAKLFSRKSDHDRAEAALLAVYGAFYLGLVPGKITLASEQEVQELFSGGR